MNTKEVRAKVRKFVKMHVRKRGCPPQNSRKMCEKLEISYEDFKVAYPNDLDEAIKDATN